MTEWGVVGVIVTLGGLIIGVGTPILKLNTTISRVIVKLESVENVLLELRKTVNRNDEKIWEKLDEHTEHISDLKTDIEILKHEQ